MGISNEAATETQISNLSPLGDACLRLDLTAIHEILEKIGYSGDEGVTDEVFSQTRTHEMVDTLIHILTVGVPHQLDLDHYLQYILVPPFSPKMTLLESNLTRFYIFLHGSKQMSTTLGLDTLGKSVLT